ncbi:MAG: phosphatidate cytidylyltransferase, partial [Gammaproteobacteria bacterium]|nr:phosphatidate cytidylyltransferase [Gammaproteobacteria bacterium]
MNQYLRELTPTHQVAALFFIVFGLLAVISTTAFLLSFKERRNPKHDARWQAELLHVRALLRTTWFMAVIFWVGWALGKDVAIVLFALISFLALREFITLSPTRRGDHRGLVGVFFVVLPIQFWLVGTARFDLFTVFIPVYVFLALPVVSALANDPSSFLERNAKLQWGIMVCVYGLSHVPALLLLSFPGYEGKSAFLVFYLVFVVQTAMLAQHLLARRSEDPESGDAPAADEAATRAAAARPFLQRLFAQAPVAPAVSSSFNWLHWFIALAVGCIVGALFSFITPFKFGQAVVVSLIACTAGSLGHLVMKALKRDRGVPHWGRQGVGVTGANGLLDRVDALCFAAPVFFHS